MLPLTFRKRPEGLGAPPMRVPTDFENSLSPEEIEQGVRDGTFAAPPTMHFDLARRQLRQMRADRGARRQRYITKAPGRGEE